MTIDPLSLLLQINVAGAVAMAESHVAKCICDQPSMKTELEAGFAFWCERNRQHVERAHERAEYSELVQNARSLFALEGAFSAEHCQEVVRRMLSNERFIDEMILEEQTRSSVPKSFSDPSAQKELADWLKR